MLRVNYHYRLHWWQFVPYRRAKKVAEVMLFCDDGVSGSGSNLKMTFCQWPNDDSKIVVYGCSVAECDEDSLPASFSSPSHPSSSSDSCAPPTPLSCYLTVTAVPSLHACRDCVRVAASYGEEEVAEAWNSCVRLSCLEHGMTVHTAFDLVTPFPKFEPRISLKRDGTVIVNTGNLLHSFNVQLETLGGGTSASSGGIAESKNEGSQQVQLDLKQLRCARVMMET